MPLALVGEVGLPKLPPFVLDQLTVWLFSATGLPLASASCAVIVTLLPATGLVELDDTRYCVPAPAAKVTVALPLVIGFVLIVALTVADPAVVGDCSVRV